MSTDLSGKIAVVTGASRGLGQRVAVRLAKHGAAVALIARGEVGLRETAAAIEREGRRALVVPADLARPEALAHIGDTVRSQLGVPTILVNGAGVFGPLVLIKDSDPQQWIDTLMVNTVSAYLTCRAFMGGMIAQGWGRIVNISSAAALHTPGPVNSAYAVSKVALNQFTRHLAAELAGTGVTANVMHPGDVKTEMWAFVRDAADRVGPEGEIYRQWAARVGANGGDDPENAADLVLDLMGDDAATVSGQFLWIKDGLQSPIPSWPAPAGQPARHD
jgi:NAD(P)-dependent dehydrogenase (short-subunit alcohol dehydrogenase family)